MLNGFTIEPPSYHPKDGPRGRACGDDKTIRGHIGHNTILRVVLPVNERARNEWASRLRHAFR